MGKDKVILVGGGGHCKVVIDAIRRQDRFAIAGIIDADEQVKDVLGVPVIGTDGRLEEIFRGGCRMASVTVGSTGDPRPRIRLAQQLKDIGFTFARVIHPAAVVAESATIAEGAFIAAGAIIGPGSVIGENVIINTNAAIDHDCRIGDFVHVAPGATVSGGVEIGENSHVGTGAAVIEYRTIGANTLIGLGSVVVSDIPANCKAYGNPCRKVAGI